MTQPTPQIYNILYILGYILENNTLTQIRQASFYNVKDKLLQAITTYYPQYNQIKPKNLLQITNDILHKHQLQILHKKQFFKKNRTFALTNLILHHYTHEMQDNTLLQTHTNNAINYPSNASNKNKNKNTLSIDITLEPLDFSDLPNINVIENN